MTTTTEPLRPLELDRRMTPSDAMFWYGESALPQFRPIIAGIYVLDRHPRAGGIEAALHTATRLVPRLRQRVVESALGLGLPKYADDRHFDVAYHLRHLSLPPPGTMPELLTLAAAVIATPLDRERPLWEAYWIDGLDGGRSAFLFKMHHSLVDGVGSMAISFGLTQRRRNDQPHRIGPSAERRLLSARGPVAQWAGSVVDTVLDTARLGLWAAGAPLRALADPAGSFEQGLSTLEGLRGLFADVGNQSVDDPIARSASGISRRLDVGEVSIERLRAIKAPLGVTLNDLVLAALAGALGAYHTERRAWLETLNCMVPMNLRSAEERDELGNRVGMINVRLPVGEKDPLRRLQLIVEQTNRAKGDRRGTMFPMMAHALPLIPGPVFSWMARSALGRVNLACTNVPGTPSAIYMAGAKVTAIYPFASPVQGTPLVMALMSYDGRLDIGVSSDPEAIPDPGRITELFQASLDELEKLSREAEIAEDT